MSAEAQAALTSQALSGVTPDPAVLNFDRWQCCVFGMRPSFRYN